MSDKDKQVQISCTSESGQVLTRNHQRRRGTGTQQGGPQCQHAEPDLIEKANVSEGLGSKGRGHVEAGKTMRADENARTGTLNCKLALQVPGKTWRAQQ